ncbi:MAG: bifunctional phosphoribosylaminoimidazolecarboxamide formyltransferase/IMP cyclohydrolase [Armatimonadota bacterium]
MPPIRRALLSVSDKTGIVELAQGLHELGIEIISTGRTATAIAEAGVPVEQVSEYTGFPEMMDGRVKTLHPRIHAGLLALRDNQQHMQELEARAIGLIDMVVCNLYPFEETVADPRVTMEDATEQIDIGGPSMVRAAAKNFRHVVVICNPARYQPILDAVQSTNGELDETTRAELALEAFQHTAAYDAAIARFLQERIAAGDGPPQSFLGAYEEIQELRYGENPHQRAAVYRDRAAVEPGIPGAKQLHGKELSFNNLLDLAAALEMARDFEDPCCVIIKHTNPCGCAVADSIAEALEDAWVCDPMSAFGSVIGFNRVVDAETARKLGNTDFLLETIEPRYREETGDTETVILAAFVECVIAPGYEPEALEILTQKKNLRIMDLPEFAPEARKRALDFRRLPGGLLMQEGDFHNVPPSDFRVVTEKQPTPQQLESMAFADRIAKHVRSNAIVLVQGKRLVGAGAGQMSRFDSSFIAARKAGKRAQGAVLASDAMFPARDGLDAAAETGAVAVIQPGGSKRDEEVIQAANEHGIVMVFTGVRHFKH